VRLAKLCLAPEIPKSLFHENENPNLPMEIKFIQRYLTQTVVEAVHLNQLLPYLNLLH
jgi:hypothetical protein